MSGKLTASVERVEQATAQFEGLIDQLLRGLGVGTTIAAESAGDDLHIMLAKPIQAEQLGAGAEFSVGSNLGVTMVGGPLGHVGMKSLAVLHNRRQQNQFASASRLAQQVAAEFIPSLALHRH